MAVTTIHAHVNRAKEFLVRDDVYFAIGRTSPWQNENTPGFEVPDEDFNALALDEIIGYKKIDVAYIVRPTEVGETPDIQYREENWMIVPPDQAIAQKARWVYIRSTILFNELPLGVYRQVGVYTGVVKKPELPAGQDNLLPTEVDNVGVLEVIDNREFSNRQLDQKEVLSLILEF